MVLQPSAATVSNDRVGRHFYATRGLAGWLGPATAAAFSYAAGETVAEREEAGSNQTRTRARG